MDISGSAVDPSPTARPVMMFVAAPVSEASAILCTGLPEVKCSVKSPIALPPRQPAAAAQ